METTTQPIKQGHVGPPLFLLACIHAVLFVGGLILCVLLAGKAFVSPFAPAEAIVDYYRFNGDAVRVQSFFLFGSSIPLGLYTATVVSRLNYLRIRVAGVTIALYGGLGASYFLAFAGLMQWVLSHPELATSTEVIRALQDVAFITGGPAQTTLLGLLLAGVAIPSLFMGLLPRWLSIFGLVLAVFGELSSLSLILPQAMIFIPLARFPGFGWLILCGAYLPKYRQGTSA
jgi:hypothetical protein